MHMRIKFVIEFFFIVFLLLLLLNVSRYACMDCRSNETVKHLILMLNDRIRGLFFAYYKNKMTLWLSLSLFLLKPNFHICSHIQRAFDKQIFVAPNSVYIIPVTRCPKCNSDLFWMLKIFRIHIRSTCHISSVHWKPKTNFSTEKWLYFFGL